MVGWGHCHMEVCILEVHAGKPLVWGDGLNYGFQGLHLEVPLQDHVVEALQVENWPKAAVFLGYDG